MATPHRAHHIIPINLKISLRCRHNIHAVRTVDCRMELEGIQDESRMMWYAARRRINIRHEMQLSWSIPTLNSVINQIQFNDFYPRSDIRVRRHAEFQSESILKTYTGPKWNGLTAGSQTMKRWSSGVEGRAAWPARSGSGKQKDIFTDYYEGIPLCARHKPRKLRKTY